MKYAATVLATAAVAVILYWLGAPPWAIYGISYISFTLFRARDREK